MADGQVGVGIIGCGNISGSYLGTLCAHPAVEVVAVADADAERARAVGEKWGVRAVRSVEELLAHRGVTLVVNITPPAAHYAVTLAALAAGKSVYNEKPLAIRTEEGRRVLALARRRGLRVGGAPDGFLRPAYQAARRVLDSGETGRPIGAAAATTRSGPEHWHPNPAFFYAPGGGPLFDLGVYYVTAIAALLGPVRRVFATARVTARRRPITGGPRAGETMTVRVPTHISAVLELRSGIDATFLCSFDIAASEMPHLEIYGTAGTLSLPDPTVFANAPARVRMAQGSDWQDVPEHTPRVERGIGAADMAEAIRDGRPARADGLVALHVLETMNAIYASAKSHVAMTVRSQPDRPEPLRTGSSG